jgi:AcrR family transcriptional regulator
MLKAMTRADERKAALKHRVAHATRISLSAGHALDGRLIADISASVGVPPRSLRVLFPTDDALLDAVNDMLVDQCVDRLRAGVDRFTPESTESKFLDASRALAKSWPLDRGGIIIRADRRLNALKSSGGGEAAVAAERRFLGLLIDVLTDLMNKLGRTFSWPPALAVRVILDTYERSFEAWILGGNSEAEFHLSPYVERTLSTLLAELSRIDDPLLGRCPSGQAADLL